MGKGKYSPTAERDRRIAVIRGEIKDLKAKVGGIIDNVKEGLWRDYRSYPDGSDPGYDAQLKALLDDYEPGVTEADVADLSFSHGSTTSTYEEAMFYLNTAMNVHGFRDFNELHVLWYGLKRDEEELARLLDGQLPAFRL